MWTHLWNAQNKLDCSRNAAQSLLQCFSGLILCCAQISTISLISSARPLTSAEASHAHVVRGYHLLLDREVVPLQRVEGRVPQDDSGVFTLILERQQFLWADGMKCLVRLRDEAGLWVFRRRDTLSMLTTIAWRHKGKRVYVESREGKQGAKRRSILGGRSHYPSCAELLPKCYVWIVHNKTQPWVHKMNLAHLRQGYGLDMCLILFIFIMIYGQYGFLLGSKSNFFCLNLTPLLFITWNHSSFSISIHILGTRLMLLHRVIDYTRDEYLLIK